MYLIWHLELSAINLLESSKKSPPILSWSYYILLSKKSKPILIHFNINFFVLPLVVTLTFWKNIHVWIKSPKGDIPMTNLELFGGYYAKKFFFSQPNITQYLNLCTYSSHNKLNYTFFCVRIWYPIFIYLVLVLEMVLSYEDATKHGKIIW